MFWPRPSKSCSSIKRCLLKSRLTVAITSSLTPILLLAASPALANESCPAALDQLQQYPVGTNETLASVAANYNLQPETLVRFNPDIGSAFQAALSPGTALTVPPFNGQVVAAGQGDSWQSLAERYGSRADLLFEVNGCVATLPSRVFVPGVNLIAPTAGQPRTFQLPGYPLSESADIALSYGWQPHSTRNELVFNSGVAFTISEQMEVRAVGQGTVAFVGQREGYGQLLVINHEQGLQTRYANLSDISVEVGQPVAQEMVVGSVGRLEASAIERAASATYLYFEVRTNSASGWIAQDPGKYLPALELR
ncbi:MAG: peptidoglycan DD-metalloendopeptidase family protein [Phormidesmis sp.]